MFQHHFDTKLKNKVGVNVLYVHNVSVRVRERGKDQYVQIPFFIDRNYK